MPFTQLQKCASDPEIPPNRHTRPKFHHRCTGDRLREASGRPPSFSMSRRVSKDRKSMFKELGLDTDHPTGHYSNEQQFTELTGLASPTSPHPPDLDNNNNTPQNIERSNTEGLPPEQESQDNPKELHQPQKPWYSRLPLIRRPRIRTASSAPPPSLSTLTRLSAIALLIAILLPSVSYYSSKSREAVPVSPNVAGAGTGAGVEMTHAITTAADASAYGLGPVYELRGGDDSKGVCKIWAGQGECRGLVEGKLGEQPLGW